MVNFAIHMRNELNNTDATLFTGKMKVAKAHSNEHGPKVVNHFVYYVDQDWNLPIGYIFLTPGSVAESNVRSSTPHSGTAEIRAFLSRTCSIR